MKYRVLQHQQVQGLLYEHYGSNSKPCKDFNTGHQLGTPTKRLHLEQEFQISWENDYLQVFYLDVHRCTIRTEVLGYVDLPNHRSLLFFEARIFFSKFVCGCKISRVSELYIAKTEFSVILQFVKFHRPSLLQRMDLHDNRSDWVDTSTSLVFILFIFAVCSPHKALCLWS